MTTNEPNQLLTPQDVAARLKVSPRFIRGAIRHGTLKAFRLGPRTNRITAADLEDFIRRFPYFVNR